LSFSPKTLINKPLSADLILIHNHSFTLFSPVFLL